MVDILRQVSQSSTDRHMPQFYGGSSADAVVDAIEAELGLSQHTSETTSIPSQQSAPEDVPQRSSSPSNDWDLPNFDAAILTAILPTKTAVDEYVDYFFRSTHQIYPVVNQKAFISWYERFWKIQDRRPARHHLIILHMILALGYQGMAATSVMLNQTDRLTMQENGITFFAAARDGLAEAQSRGGGLPIINALILGVSPFPSFPPPLTA